jgi:hypothetical protein
VPSKTGCTSKQQGITGGWGKLAIGLIFDEFQEIRTLTHYPSGQGSLML